MTLFHLRSDLPIEQYHQYSDAPMDRLLESLEDLIDEVADPGYEVEYGVRVRMNCLFPLRASQRSRRSGDRVAS